MVSTVHRISERLGLPDGDVRAVIEAIRVPTPAMLRAACASMSPDKRPTKKRVGVKAKHGIRYRAMIDAALDK